MWTSTQTLTVIGLGITVSGLLLIQIIATVRYAIAQLRRTDALHARIEQLTNEKVSVTDCVRNHGDTVTKPFCEGQHARSNSALEKLTEEFGGLAIELRGIGKDVEWLKSGLRVLHDGVAVANPHPIPLPPDPRDREARNEWEPEEE